MKKCLRFDPGQLRKFAAALIGVAAEVAIIVTATKSIIRKVRKYRGR